jgi:hypothetical protein
MSAMTQRQFFIWAHQSTPRERVLMPLPRELEWFRSYQTRLQEALNCVLSVLLVTDMFDDFFG